MFATSQGFAPGAPDLAADAAIAQTAEGFPQEATETASASGIPLPTPSPNAPDAASRAPVTVPANAAVQPLVQASTAVDALNRGITQSQPAQPGANLYAAVTPAPAPAPETISATIPEPVANPTQPAAVAQAQSAPDESEAPKVQELAVVAPPKKQSIFSRIFAPQAKAKRSARPGTTKRIASPEPKRVAMASATVGQDTLPGVSLSALFGLGPENGANGNSADNIQLASAAGLARLAPNGLRTQTDKVKVDCFKPQLVRVLKTVERHYGRPVVVTSGYRSPKHNRRIGGASGSRHTSCEAADIQVEGVSKWQLAKYLRSMPGRGGVGTYCHTESVHIDVGNTRDWNWRCRRRK
jgi:uncharacterized protein YcbK (DUF882 family)